jgi:hypothetical protein
MMSEKERKFDVSAETLLELKAQILRKQQEAELNRKNPAKTEGESKSKGGDLSVKRTKKAATSKLPEKRTITLDEADEWAKSREALERKARLYELMERGEVNISQVAATTTQKEAILVDFDRKGWDSERQEFVNIPEGEPSSSNPFEYLAKIHGERINNDNNGEEEEKTIEYIDEFGRTRRVTLYEKTLLERERTDSNYFSQYEESHVEVGPAHFDADREIRTKGIGFFKFSKDEMERQRQMNELKSMREETIEERTKAEQARRQTEALSALIKERKNAKG